jgi:hypothetical protein
VKKFLVGETARYLTRKRQEAAQRDAERQQARRHPFSNREPERRLRQSRQAVAARDRRPPVTIVPPSAFSLLENTDNMLTMLDEMTTTAKQGRSLFMEMKDVESITPEAIAVLDATLGRLVETYRVAIFGSEPGSSKMTDILRSSGFYSHVRPPASAKFIAPDTGIIAHEENSIVDGRLSQELIHFATERLTGSRIEHHASYAALGEMMQNTFDHAHRRRPGYERWWASVYFDDVGKVAHFTFFDTGVGIFGSREVSGLKDHMRALFVNDADFLKDIFEGQIASRTGVPWRGQGLPRIYQRVQRRELTEMIVITNAVKGYLDKGEFVALKHKFVGTLYHWELRHHDKSDH